MSTYIVDKEYRLLYLDEAMKERFPDAETGDFCYQRFCGNESPCLSCPCHDRAGGKRLLFNKTLRRWIEIETCALKWPEDCGNMWIRARMIDPTEKHPQIPEYRGYENGVDEVRDVLTGLYRRKEFLSQATDFLKKRGMKNWCLAAIDIEHFKLFNEWYGQKAGDCLLRDIGLYLNSLQEEKNYLAGYFGGDDFYMILPDQLDSIEKILQDISAFFAGYGKSAGFLPVMGVYRIEGEVLPISTMCDKAQIAISSVKGKYRKRIGWFDHTMMQIMEKRQTLLSDVQQGIINREFVFYAQPKCNLSTGKIVGLEALVRWNHPHLGIVPPGEYIPFLEKNGLIADLDLYVWELVCQALRDWLDAGKQVVPISVNVSLADIYTVDVPQVFDQLVKKYRLSPADLEIEITESAYVEEYDTVRNMVERMHQMGFTVSMDDFGSGYSSLNMLKDINVDVLKIDMKFLHMDARNHERGINILESIVRLINLMDLKLIAEGVENQEQIEFLMKMGCIYGQGYYFYRPMPKDQLEGLLSDESNLDRRGIRKRQINPIYPRDLFGENVINDMILNNILGPVAFWETDGGRARIVRVNEQYCELVGVNLIDMEDSQRRMILYVNEGDRIRVAQGFEEARQNPMKGSIREVCRRKVDGSSLWLTMRIYFLREQNGKSLFYVAYRDETETRMKEEELNYYISLMPGAYHRCEKNKDFDFLYISERFLDMFGYTREEICTLFDNKYVNMVHPDDRCLVSGSVRDMKKDEVTPNIEYRMLSSRGYIRVIDQTRLLNVNGKEYYQGVVMEITDEEIKKFA